MDMRQARAEQILATSRVVREGHIFFVPSQSGGPRYHVILEPTPTCSCKDFADRQQDCKHILAAMLFIEREKVNPIFPPLEAQRPPKRPTYRQEWAEYNAAQTNEKAHLQELLADLCRTVPEPPAARTGRKPIPLADSLFAAVFKVYSTVSARRFMCDLEDAHQRDHVSRLPRFNSVLNGLENPAATPVLFDLIRLSALPLREVESDFAVDSSGFLTSRFDRWFDVKYGSTKKVQTWVKVHAICGVKTNVVTAVEVLDMHSGDSPRLPPLVEATAKGFKIAEVSADKAYASNENFEAVAGHGGTLYAPFKSNASGYVGGLYEKMFHLFCLNRDDYLKHYHKRSNVESTFSMVKRKFGDSLRSKSETAMKNESLAKILCHNVCCLVSAWYELGIVPSFGPADEQPRHVLRFPG